VTPFGKEKCASKSLYELLVFGIDSTYYNRMNLNLWHTTNYTAAKNISIEVRGGQEEESNKNNAAMHEKYYLIQPILIVFCS
jgi:hypothetical protein